MPKLLAIDLDGTLFYPKKRLSLVPKENVRFLKAAKAAGHEVVFVTSRNREFVEKVLQEIDLDLDFICRNGSVVIHQHQVVVDHMMSAHDAEQVFQYIAKRRRRFMASLDSKTQSNLVFTNNYGWYLSYVYKLYYLFQGRYREDYVQNNGLFMQKLTTGQDIQRILIYFGFSPQAKAGAFKESIALKEVFPHLEIAWVSGIIEIAAKGTNKGNALLTLVKAMHWPKEDVIVIGDSGNDISMFETFDESYCMVHAHPEVKKHARHLLKRVHHLSKVLNL